VHLLVVKTWSTKLTGSGMQTSSLIRERQKVRGGGGYWDRWRLPVINNFGNKTTSIDGAKNYGKMEVDT
jgi:hypothetical protein